MATRTGRSYVVVWLGLAGLTTLTWALSKLSLGGWAMPVALLIASAKAGLIVLFFMHLREQPSAAAVAGLASLVYLAVLIALTLADVLFRFQPAVPPGPVHPQVFPRPSDEPNIPGDQTGRSPRSR